MIIMPLNLLIHARHTYNTSTPMDRARRNAFILNPRCSRLKRDVDSSVVDKYETSRTLETIWVRLFYLDTVELVGV